MYSTCTCTCAHVSHVVVICVLNGISQLIIFLGISFLTEIQSVAICSVLPPLAHVHVQCTCMYTYILRKLSFMMYMYIVVSWFLLGNMCNVTCTSLHGFNMCLHVHVHVHVHLCDEVGLCQTITLYIVRVIWDRMNS